MTAVEWFNKQIVDKQNGNGDSRSWDEILEQAKEMEKEQIVDAVNKFALGSDEVVRIILKKYNLLNTGESYYNETYGK